MPKPRKRISTPCSICGTVNSVRKDFLQSISRPYRCRHCPPKRKPKTFAQKLKTSKARRKYALNEDFFEHINNEEKCYWLGFLAGDGARTENKVRLCLSIKDKDHLQKFKSAVEWTGKDYFHKDTNALEVYFGSFKMSADLAKYGVVPRKTFIIQFPKIPKHLEVHFVRGLFDADGCISRAKRITVGKKGQKYIYYGGEFCIEGNKKFILVLRDKLMVLGLPLTSIDYSGKKINRVRYGGINQLKTIYDYMYKDATVFLSRKKNLFEDILENYYTERIS